MNRLIGSFFVGASLFASTLSAQIVEISHFEEVLQYVKPNTLVLLDIDDTLLEPVQELGNDVWFRHQLQHNQAILSDKDEALNLTLDQWIGIRMFTEVKIVEEGIQDVVAEMQSKDISIIGLTTQGYALKTCTPRQLKSLGIDLTLTAPSQEDLYFNTFKEAVLFSKGILFTSGNPKGLSLLDLLKKLNLHPEHIVFVNDKRAHLLDVEQGIAKVGIDFMGLRYGYSDERVKKYDRDIANLQFENFRHIMSNQTAINNLYH